MKCDLSFPEIMKLVRDVKNDDELKKLLRMREGKHNKVELFSRSKNLKPFQLFDKKYA